MNDSTREPQPALAAVEHVQRLFGGIGNSGMGNYHGGEGFRELSRAKTVFRRRRWFPTQLFYPPYGTRLQQRHAGPAPSPTRAS